MDLQPKKALPKVLLLRAERILAQPIAEAFYISENIARCQLSDKSIRYVDLHQAKEIPAAQIKIDVENWGEADTNLLVGKPEPRVIKISDDLAKELVDDPVTDEIKDKNGIAGEAADFISRPGVVFSEEQEKLIKDISASKKVSKKKSTKPKK